MGARISRTPSTGSTANSLCKSVSTTPGDYANFFTAALTTAISHRSFVRAFFCSPCSVHRFWNVQRIPAERIIFCYRYSKEIETGFVEYVRKKNLCKYEFECLQILVILCFTEFSFLFLSRSWKMRLMEISATKWREKNRNYNILYFVRRINERYQAVIKRHVKMNKFFLIHEICILM